MTELQQGTRLGILGGGQLGRMLGQAALDFALRCSWLDPDPQAPCSDAAGRFEEGSLTDPETVLRFGRRHDLVTVEIENVSCDALEQLEREGIQVHPSAQALRLVQDKGLQKQFLQSNGLPTAEFQLVEGRSGIRSRPAMLPAFQKLRREGYDGRGVRRIASPGDIEEAFDKPSVLERQVDVRKELSVIAARGRDGRVSAFPAAELQFHPERNLVEYILSPAEIRPETSREASDLACRAAQALQIVGLLAVELFLAQDGRLLINELSPRPHNSGHHTIVANFTSQYHQHLRAILGLPLGDPGILSPAVMANLLGEPGHQGEARWTGVAQALSIPGLSLHLYAKRQTFPFRKMGHLTVIDADPQNARAKARRARSLLKVVA